MHRLERACEQVLYHQIGERARRGALQRQLCHQQLAAREVGEVGRLAVAREVRARYLDAAGLVRDGLRRRQLQRLPRDERLGLPDVLDPYLGG